MLRKLRNILRSLLYRLFDVESAIRSLQQGRRPISSAGHHFLRSYRMAPSVGAVQEYGRHYTLPSEGAYGARCLRWEVGLGHGAHSSECLRYAAGYSRLVGRRSGKFSASRPRLRHQTSPRAVTRAVVTTPGP